MMEQKKYTWKEGSGQPLGWQHVISVEMRGKEEVPLMRLLFPAMGGHLLLCEVGESK